MHAQQTMSYMHFKICKVICLIICLFLCATPLASLATAEEKEMAVSKTDAKAAVLVEASTLQILMENGSDTLVDVAGLSKMPALLVICEAVDAGKLALSEQISVSVSAAKIGGPSAFIEGGEVIAASNLIKAAVMIGAGDAIMALGEHIFGTETAFLSAIQERMQLLSIATQQSDILGLSTQFSPLMLAKLGAKLMESPCFAAHSKLMLDNILHADGRQTELVSANRLLRNFAGCGGVMTGSSPADGYSGVFSVQRGDTQLIAVVIGCKNSSTRFAAAEEMLNQAFATTRAQKLCVKGEIVKKDIRVTGGRQKQVNLVAKDTIVLLLDKAEPSLQAIEDIPLRLRAPISEEDILGTITYQTAEGEVRGKVELVPQVAVPAYSFRDLISDILLEFIRM